MPDAMDCDEFVRRYCDGKTPTTRQRATINEVLDATGPHFELGAGSGRTTLRRWLIRWLASIEFEESGGYNNWLMVDGDAERRMEHRT